MTDSNKSFFGKRAGGYRFVKAAPDAAVYRSSRRFDLPPKVDLRPLMTPVENQGNLNSCTANAIAGAYEYLLKKHLSRPLDVSRLFIYYNARWRDGSQHEDEGSVIQYGMESLKKYGACPENVWPYRETAVLQKPPKTTYGEAARFKALDMQRVELDLDQWKKALAEGFPIVFGCALFDSFDDCTDNGGVVPMPKPKEVKRGDHSLHAMLCVGYSDVDQVFVVRNSWGSDWGVKGYCYMPYDYLMSETFNGGDCWILRSAAAVPNPQETWVLDEGSLIEAFGRVAGDLVSAFAKDAYADLEKAFFGHDEAPDWDESSGEDYHGEDEDDADWVEDDEDWSEDDAEDEEEAEDEESEEEDDSEETDEESDEDSEEEEEEEEEDSEEDEEDDESEDDESEEDDEDSEDEEESEDEDESEDEEESDEDEDSEDEEEEEDEESDEEEEEEEEE